MDTFYHTPTKRVGYWITDRKFKRLNFNLFELLCSSKGIKLIKLDLDRDLNQQGPFHLILHKVSDMVNNLNDIKTAERLERFQGYILQHSELKVIDPLDRVFSLLNRNLQYQFAQQCNLLDGSREEFFVPSFTELKTKDFNLNRELVAMNNISFPIVCKSSVSTHPGKTQFLGDMHDPDEMMIIFDERGLGDIEPPCVVQSFINHNARLYKVFVVGDRHFTIERPSIKNFYPGPDTETIFFKSSDISKSNSSSVLNKLDDDDLQRNNMIEVESSKVDRLVRSLKTRFRLELFGVDVIIENNSGRYGVIDLNPFPGYDGVRDFLPCLLGLVERKMEEKNDSSPVISPCLSCSSSSSSSLLTLSSLSLSPSSSSSSSSSPSNECSLPSSYAQSSQSG